MKKAWPSLLILMLSAAVFASESEPVPFELKGEWRQGNLLIGKTEPGAKVWFNEHSLILTPQGEFVFGLDRDEKSTAKIRLQLPGGKVQVFNYPIAERTYQLQNIDGLPPGMVTPSPDALIRIEKEQKKIGNARNRDTPITSFTQPFIWPCEGRISGVFGSQRILNSVPKQPHYGVDVAVPIGTPVKAPADAEVSLAEPDLYFTGGTLMLDHGHGLTSTMVHLSKLLVKAGDKVKQGQVIAESGMTGRATGPHLHWGVSWFNARVDAQALVPPMPVTAPVVTEKR